MSRVQHIGLTVGDLDVAVAFYLAMTGGTLEGPFERIGPGVDRVTGHRGAIVRQALVLPPEGGALIELLQYSGIPVSQIDPDNAHVGAVHVALEVADLEAALATAAGLGYRALSDPIVGGTGPLEGFRLLYVLGPDDVRVELLQPPAHP